MDEIRQSHDKGIDYDICLIDWKMPGMDGIETTKQIRSIVGPDTVIIVITAYDYSEIEQSARAAGADRLLSKPLFASSLFNMLLDVTSLKIQTPQTDEQPAQPNLSGRRILLAEDNELNLEIAMEILNMNGLIVEDARDGKEAFERFIQSDPGYYDAILLDIQMPVMDGYASARAIRSSSHPSAKKIPIIAMTANAFEEDVAAALEAGMDAHISKPIDIEVLLQTLNRFLIPAAADLHKSDPAAPQGRASFLFSRCQQIIL